MKNIRNFHLKIILFIAVKYCSVLHIHGRVFVMFDFTFELTLYSSLNRHTMSTAILGFYYMILVGLFEEWNCIIVKLPSILSLLSHNADNKQSYYFSHQILFV